MNQALLIVDLQNDFLPKGALAVPGGDEIIPVINQILPHFQLVVASLDWHPINHVSFASTFDKEPGDKMQDQILWPTHCVQNTKGSAFPTSFKSEKVHKIFYKGHQKEVDSYSIFFDQKKNSASDIHRYFQEKKVEELFVVGLATDYCVLETVLDARRLGYRVVLIEDGCRAVNIESQDEEKAFNHMRQSGASIIQSADLFLRQH